MAGRRLNRALELTAGMITWSSVTAPLWGPALVPDQWAIFFAIFSLFWLYKSISLAVCGLVGYLRLRRDTRRDWLSALRRLPGWGRVHHLVVFPTYTEPVAVLQESLEHLVRQDFPKDQISVVLAFEERDPSARDRARLLEERFQGIFAHLWVTFHADAPYEVKGKSSNLAYAVKWARMALLEEGWVDPSRTIVTVCDADSRLHPRYLSALAYAFLTDPAPQQRLYQPAVLFYANLHRIPWIIRILDGLYSVGQLARMARGYGLVTQSTYSLPLETCHAAGYWDVDVIPEDSHMFFKVFFRCGPGVLVRPMFIPVLADAAEGPDLWRTLANHYRQARRWAWGVSDVPYVLWHAVRSGRVPALDRSFQAAHYVYEHLMWPSHWFLLVGGMNLLPAMAPDLLASPMGVSLSHISSLALAACLPTLAAIAWLDRRLYDWAPAWVQTSRLSVLAWAFLPVIGPALFVLPALEAHTRLLLGRRLEYWVTEKVGDPKLDLERV